MASFRSISLSSNFRMLFILATWFIISPLCAADILTDADFMKKANQFLFEGNYQSALGFYSKISESDLALHREAVLGKCFCFTMLAFDSKNPDDAIQNFSELIKEAHKGVNLTGLDNGMIFTNLKFISGLLNIFENLGHLGVGDTAQGMVLKKDSNYDKYSQYFSLGTEAQQHFLKFFEDSRTLSDAIGKLSSNDFQECAAQAGAISSDIEHIMNSAKALKAHAERLVRVVKMLDDLKSAAEKIKPDDPARGKVIGLISQITDELKK
ncbi:MAG: hypothetical protein HQM08_04660 [Candidatus Riflebacteria bacterium]|nr:hypothetical protein [Candidatus Riflebacteria bacterium]